ncbi:helix-turn-helix domain-containing protein [Mangrovibacillus cuniculi]|uniref:Helix-turn-helix transcriptional regulator n=1 Tax=Mangrovibacillus cuniculi TaxID=2593652 RepID=A0A7S8HGM5_9BACI|nr:helix-turn-helix transcriptional regulator [Mangrovibacillus cuniculi]QPC47585.1 helix-turn-helix transcriptional regulator [Mangrovibacillus cuniculi]
MGLGSVVKYYRLKAGMTQNELCREICSVSHLSKIENDSYEGNEETLSLLFERLGIELEEEQEKLIGLEKELHSLLNAIRYLDEEKIKYYYASLKPNKDYCSSSKLLFLYEIVMMWYYNYINDVQKAIEIQDFLEKLFKNMDKDEQCLYVIGYSRNLVKNNEPTKALEYLENNNKYIYSTYEQDYLFQLGYCCSLLCDFKRAITYMNKCIPIFQEELNIMKLISAKIVLGITYTNTGLLDEASSIYTNILRNLRMLGKRNLYYQTLYNYGLTLLEKKEYEEALIKFEKIAKDLEASDITFIWSKLSMINVYIKIGRDKDLLLIKIEELIEDIKLNKFEQLSMYAQRLKFQLTMPEKKYYEYLENKHLPFLQSTRDFEESKIVEMELAQYYEKVDPLKAIRYYKNYI